MKLTLEPMTEEHLEQLLDIEALCFTHGWSRITLKAILEDENSLFLVAKKEDRIAGYGGIHWVIDECNLDNIAVHPNEQGQGIGKKILQELIKIAKEKQMEIMMLEVRESNQIARDLYQTLGFYEVGKRKDYYTKPLEAAILMNLDL